MVVVMNKEEVDGLQVVWFDRMFDFGVFAQMVKQRFGVEADEIYVKGSRKDDPRLVRIKLKPEQVSGFQDFFRDYDVSCLPPVPLQQEFYFDEQ